MFCNSPTPQPFTAATTVAWSEVRVGDRVRPIKIVGLPLRDRRPPVRSLTTAQPINTSPSTHNQKDA